MSNNIHPITDQLVSRRERELFFNQKAQVFWMTGLSGSGKSTIAKGVERALFDQGYFIEVIDGDDVRTGLCNNLGFSIEDRAENIRRVAELARLFINSGVIVLCSFISPTIKIRQMARDIIGSADFREIFINTTLNLCEKRDVKGLYKKARSGAIKGFTGIDSPYEAPIDPAMIIRTEDQTIEESVTTVVQYVKKQVTLKLK